MVEDERDPRGRRTRNRDDLDKAVKALVAAANKDGGEDNITAVAFRISAEAAPSLEDTVAMPALTRPRSEPDEQTREYAEDDAPARAGTTSPPDSPGRAASGSSPIARASS